MVAPKGARRPIHTTLLTDCVVCEQSPEKFNAELRRAHKNSLQIVSFPCPFPVAAEPRFSNRVNGRTIDGGQMMKTMTITTTMHMTTT